MKFVFDLDGTLVFQGKPMAEPIASAIAEIVRDGHEVVFASGRPIRDMIPVIDPRLHHCAKVGGNGSLVAKGETLLHTIRFLQQEIETILRWIEEFEAAYLIDGDWDYAYTGSYDHPILQNLDPAGLAKRVDVRELSAIVKILILKASDLDQFAERLSGLDVNLFRYNDENILDISPRGINKWAGLQSLGIQPREYVAFGNDVNDLSLFENAGHAVMVGFHETLAAAANETVRLDDDVERTVAEKIRELAGLM